MIKMGIFNTPISLTTILLFTLILSVGCKDDDTPVRDAVPIEISSEHVLIANQGNFGWGEGTLSIYDNKEKEVSNDLYKQKNDESLGNVFQSIGEADNRLFFVINNSGKIVVTDKKLVKIGEITGLESPRYFYQVSENKAYVTDLYFKAISVVDLRTYAITRWIYTDSWIEKGVLKDSMFWCIAPDKEKVFSINVNEDRVVDEFDVGSRPDGIVLDKNDYVRVLVTGQPTGSPYIISIVDVGGEDRILASFLSGIPKGLAYNEDQHMFYYLKDNEIWRCEGDLQNGRSSLWVTLNEGSVLYSIAVDPESKDIYVSDVKDFVSKSTIYRYRKEGALLDEFSAGIIAGDFFFP
jgi:DNA-binding beta-propeller fold protein YncE